jgi:serine/threonine protein kinase
MTYEEFLQRYKFDQQDQQALLGAGGFGSVYKAFDSIQKRYVAIKVAEVKHEKFNLLYEKRIVDELDTHENIARYGNCFRFQFMPVRYDFAILTYYEEGNLADVLTKYALSLAQKHEILKGIVSGVGHLHEHHIIHRDMKPQNVLMERKNNRWVPKLTDFGLSKLSESNTSAMENSSIGLSIAYASPEQIRNHEIRPNCDLWSVGVIGYQMFVGELPFEAPRNMSQESWNIQVSQQIVKGELPEKISLVPEPYRTLIKKCFVTDNVKRVQRASELLTLLDQTTSEQSPEKNEEIDDHTFRIPEPFFNVKELTERADELLRNSNVLTGIAKEAKVNEAIKTYIEVLRIDPKNSAVLRQLEVCKALIKKETNRTPAISKQKIFIGLTLLFLSSTGYFLYWKAKAEKELTWAKNTYFSAINYSDTTETYHQVFSILEKYSGTPAMDDTTNNLLGNFYRNAQGGALLDYKKAMTYYEKASDYEWGQFNMGYLNFWGRGTKKDYQAALPYFEEAYKIKQLADAADYLGYIYLKGGQGIKLNYDLAKSWFEKAAQNNSAYSQNELGKMYLNGLGVPVNTDRAKYYFNLAAKQGNTSAQQALYTLNNNSRANTIPSLSFAPGQLADKKDHTKNKPGSASDYWQKAAENIIKNALRR